jgi:hypothetical protein
MQHPRPCADAAVRRLEALDVVDRHQVVGVGLGLRAAIDDARRRDEVLAGIVSTELLARSLPEIQWIGASKWRAGVLAAREVVPVPGRAARVVGRDLLDPERPALAHLGRQRDLREVGAERLRQVDDADAPAGERGGELAQQRRRGGGGLRLFPGGARRRLGGAARRGVHGRDRRTARTGRCLGGMAAGSTPA